MGQSNPGPQPQGEFFCFFTFEKPRQNSVSLDHLISFLAFVFGKLWPKVDYNKLNPQGLIRE